jgi:cytoskeletal protein RodZ
MENLGKYFLELRQTRGISYEKILDDIMIPQGKIQAIEDNRFYDLGNYGMVKVLVYNYARYLEADLAMVMAELKILMPETTKKDFVPHRTLKEKKIMLSTNFLWMVGIFVIAAILGSILLHSYKQGLLVAPDFFAKDAEKQETSVTRDEPERPDSLRTRMRVLSETIPSNDFAGDQEKDRAFHDNTDYLGEILGESVVNVGIN